MRQVRTGAKRRLVERLKRTGASTAGEVAGSLDLTDVAVRQHLTALERGGYVSMQIQPPAGRGRPSVRWSLAPLAHELFPDHHGDLTLDLIDAARHAFGQEGLDRIVQIRARAGPSVPEAAVAGQSIAQS